MRGTRGGTVIAAIVMSIALACSMVGIAAAATSSRKGGSLTFLLSSEATTFDPRLGNGQTTFGPVVMGVYDELIHIDPVTHDITPGLASSVTGNADATVWTIKLRPNLKFSDGTPLDAAAIKVNWDRYADPTVGAPIRGIVTTFTSYVVVDPTTLKVTLPTGVGSFPIYLGGAGGTTGINGGLGLIASPTALTKYGKNYGSSPETTVGAGPFLLKEWVRGDHVTEVPNPDYYDHAAVQLDSIVFKPLTDTTQKANALVAGQADMGFFPTPNADTQTVGQAGFKANGLSQPASITAIFNESQAPYDDVRVRQALQLATNQADVNAKAQANQATPTDVWFPKTSPFYDPSLKIKTNNLAAAQKLIDAYVAEKGPVKGTFMITTSLQTIGTVLLQEWAQLKNVTITPDLQTPTASQANLVTGNYALALSATPNITTLEDVYGVWHSGAASNVIHFSDPTVDKLLDQNRAIKDITRQKEAVDKMVSIVIDKAAYIPLFRNLNQTFTSKNVKGYKNWSFAFPFDQFLSRAGG
jgi:ABC-type transport system substrate-binding protein